MSYALYEGDSRSAWERLDWVSWQEDHARTALVPERKKEVEDLHEITREVESLIIESMDVPLKEAGHPPDQTWVRIGYIVFFGLIIAIIGDSPSVYCPWAVSVCICGIWNGVRCDRTFLRHNN